ncbi:DNA primase [Candidatus Hakubella thermalkaliphila]|uniref:DNA primase n=1 Tax=Candidatus Hakubella thermalkaliphila TaxID=2754717 RepID=A0A6V8PK22_9ACTN|nr:DNA primase [Candidatus Hakubella thermalkaliphila]
MTPRLADGELEEIRERNDLVALVSEYTRLKKTGKNYSGLCPFHKEKTPSFVVDSGKQLYHCFGCGEGGDVFSFVMKIESLEFPEAIQRLADRVGYKPKYQQVRAGEGRGAANKEKIYRINQLAKDFYRKSLKETAFGQECLQYLLKRGYTEETIDFFEIGSCTEKWAGFAEYALDKGISLSDLLASGLAIRSEKSSRGFYDQFRHRIIFPITDVMDRVVAFGGRVIDDSLPKYVNSPETPVYQKGKVVYGLSKAKGDMVKQDQALIVEGYTDVMAFHQCGIYNVVASLGTALTIDQIRLIARFTNNIVLVFDSDTAGEKATERGIDLLKEYNGNIALFNQHNINLSAVVLPSGMDPADYMLSHGKEEFSKLLEQARPLIDFTIDSIISRFDLTSAQGKLAAIDRILEFLSTLSSRIVQEEYIKVVAEKLSVEEERLMRELIERNRRARGRISQGRVEQKKQFFPYDRLEREALRLIIHDVGEARKILLNLEEDVFQSGPNKDIFRLLKDGLKGSKETDVSQLLSAIEREELRRLFSSLLFEEREYENEKTCQEVFYMLKELDLKRQISILPRKMEKLSQQGDQEEADRLFEEILRLEGQRRALQEERINQDHLMEGQ